MKKLIVAVITLFIGTTAFSQEIDLGVKAGANFSSITDASGLSNRTGLLGGAFAAIKFTDKVALQGELLYSQQGAEFDDEKIDLNYVNVPVILKYYFVQGLNLQVGPQFGFIVDDNVEEVFGNIAEAEDSDVTGIVGLGYDFPFGIRVDGRYNFGFTEVFKDTDGKNSVISVALGYSFL